MNTTTSFLKPSLTATTGEVQGSTREVLGPRRGYCAARLEGTRNGWPMRLVYLGSDLVAFGVSAAIAKGMVACTVGGAASALATNEAKLFLLWAVGLMVVAASQHTYAPIPPRPVRKFRGWVMGASTACVAIVAAAWLFEVSTWIESLTLVVATGLAILLASFCRALCRMTLGKTRWWGTRLVVVGRGELAERTYLDLIREPQWGLRPVGFVDDTSVGEGGGEPTHCLGSVEQLDALAVKHDFDRALAALHAFDAAELGELVSRSGGRIQHWIILPPLAKFPAMWLEACEAARRPALAVTNRLRSSWSLPLKRVFDLSVAVALGLAALPLVGLIALLVRLSSPGSVFYGQERIGRFGRRFKAWKFRTMLPSADQVLARYLDEHPVLAVEWQANHKLRDDPRVTWVGQWLRITSLDELPQVWNVITGEMSLVGPRPIVAAEIDKYAEHYEQYVQVLPGITGLWQVSGRNNTTYEERVALDVYYVQNWSLWLDVYILACTAKVVLLREGAY